ncbi:MAG: Phosphopantetheine adenylyltransferase [Phycisphaerae bacterium]|nr:Phosphopantetheine adenylyltransferase [Phycisphaerae bacterium]
MPDRDPRMAVFPGSFDPFTYGHLDIIRRGARLFDRLVIGVGKNPDKPALFSANERVEMIRQETADITNVEVLPFEGLTFEFVLRLNAKVILRGIRDSVDLRSELQAANTNLMVGDVETVFLLTTDQHALTSSTLIKQVVELGGADRPSLSRIVPPAVLDRLLHKLNKPG